MTASKTGLFFLAVALSWPVAAFAQASGDDALAQILFEEGKQALNEKDYANACPKFEKSRKLSPAGGTLLFLAICREGEGKTASAWVLFNNVVSEARAANRADREQVAREHLDELTPKLLKVTIVVAAPVADEALSIDGVAMSREAWGVPFPADPGVHTLEARAPSKVTHRATFRVPAAGPVTIPPLKRDLAAEAKAVTRTPLAPDRAPVRTQATLGIVGVALGAVGLGLGAGFGTRSVVKHSDAEDECKLGVLRRQCSQQGLDADAAAKTAGTVSTIGFLAGGALLVAGAVVWLTAPRAPAKIALVPTRSGAMLAGGVSW